jgi:N-acetylglutamate synthase-like GNAT family acetyltransferase
LIRKATKFDINILVPMIKQYAEEAPIELFKNETYQDHKYVAQLLYEIIAVQGFILVDQEINGFLIAVIVPNIWCPKVIELKELAWWVKPEYRKTTLGGKLWLQFNDEGNKMLDNNRVQIICTTTMSSSPALNYEKRGYKLLESTYFKE